MKLPLPSTHLQLAFQFAHQLMVLRRRWRFSDACSPQVRLRFGLTTPSTRLGLPVGACLKFFCPNVTGSTAGLWNGRPDAEKDETEVERKCVWGRGGGFSGGCLRLGFVTAAIMPALVFTARATTPQRERSFFAGAVDCAPRYTPTSSDRQLGSFDVVIKVYKAGLPAQFADGGKMSQHMGRLRVGDTITCSGPWGPIAYTAPGTFEHAKKAMVKTHIGMMAGGSGITPMLQVLTAVFENPSDATHCSLIYANKTEVGRLHSKGRGAALMWELGLRALGLGLGSVRMLTGLLCF